jgi:hypothetical protein
MRTIALLIVALAAPTLAAGCHHANCPACASSPAPESSPGWTVEGAVSAAPRPPSLEAARAGRAGNGFELVVRDDFFDGLRGDTAALDRVVKACEETLAKEPRHAQAMVWHGAAMIGRAGLAFRGGDAATGLTLYRQGLAEMDRAVELDPRNIGVRIPRGAVVLAAVQLVPEQERAQLLGRGVADYELALATQSPYFDKLSLHAREQLLYGLTEAYASLGDQAKAQAMFRRMTKDASGSALLARAKARAAGEAVAGPTPCEECHGR